MRKIIIKKNENGQRFDRFVSKYLNKANNSFVQKMIRKKNIELNDKKAKPETILKEHDTVKFYLAEDTIDKFRSEKSYVKTNKNLEILYEDKNIIIVNKPVGITIQPDHTNEVSLVDILLSYLNFDENYISKTFRPAFINRLDKNTSGIVIAAKNYNTLKILNKSMRNKNFSKAYKAITEGVIEKEILLKDYITRDNRVSYVNKDKKGKEIITKIKPIKTSNNYSLVEIELLTGRTHQIRTHLNSIGHPLVGDRKYNSNSSEDTYYLHAYKMIVNNIDEKLNYLKNKSFEAELPLDFLDKIKELFG